MWISILSDSTMGESRICSLVAYASEDVANGASWRPESSSKEPEALLCFRFKSTLSWDPVVFLGNSLVYVFYLIINIVNTKIKTFATFCGKQFPKLIWSQMFTDVWGNRGPENWTFLLIGELCGFADLNYITRNMSGNLSSWGMSNVPPLRLDRNQNHLSESKCGWYLAGCSV